MHGETNIEGRARASAARLRMADNINGNIGESDADTCLLIDEDGNENPFEIIGELEIDGAVYLALMPLDSDECEYVILKKELDENGEDIYVTIDDDDEFESVAEAFEDRMFDELDLDELEDMEPDEDAGEEEE